MKFSSENACVANRPCPFDDGWKSCKFPLSASSKRLSGVTLYYLQPFRRLCVDLGADITCGESKSFFQLRFVTIFICKFYSVGLATSFLAGSKEEWSLVRRHPSESIFGIQVAGNKPANLVPTAEVIAKECGSNVDFVDLNCGCPIDLVFKTGSGSACT